MEAAADRKKCIQQRASMNERELLFLNELFKAGYLRRGEHLPKKTLLTVINVNKFTLATLRLSSASSRGAIEDAWLKRIQNKTLELLPTQTENNACNIR